MLFRISSARGTSKLFVTSVNFKELGAIFGQLSFMDIKIGLVVVQNEHTHRFPGVVLKLLSYFVCDAKNS